jgi:imidazolonepropionase-like amidohydrolase
VAHAAGKPVFAPPSNRTGVEHALAGGADVLAHTIPMEPAFTTDALQQTTRRRVALIPTLALFPDEVRKEGGPADRQRAILERAIHQVRQYFQTGGPILFGTDVGYTQLYDPTAEYEHLQRAGLTWRDILAALTTNPARTFGAGEAGEVAAGGPADLVVLDADPATDVRNFARVSHTLRRGRILYAK